MSDQSQRPTRDSDREGWRAYWTSQSMPWRTEPEIDPSRQAYLAERREVQPDIEKGIYPFRDERGPIKLYRADVEWLLATHMNGDWVGTWSRAIRGLPKKGLDLRGADLRFEDLRRLPLMQLRAGLDSITWRSSSDSQREAASIHLEGANLHNANLQDSAMRGAHLESANLESARIEGTAMRSAHFGGLIVQDEHGGVRRYPGTAMRAVYMDFETNLHNVDLGSKSHGHARLADVHWVDADVTTIDWSAMPITGDEEQARKGRTPEGKRKDAKQRLEDYQTAARGYRQLASIVRSQGLTEDADHFAYRASLCHRVALRIQHRYFHYVGSLSLDLLAGYGFRPGRTFFWYLFTIVGFAFLFMQASFGWIPFGLPRPSEMAPLPWYEALILSVSSFHGRGFFQPLQSLGDPIAALAALEAVIGLFIEISFIATFTQRYFGQR